MPLSEYFLERFSAKNGLPLSVLDGSAKTALEEYQYPGNVRELEQLMNKLAVEAAGRPVTESSIRPHLQASVKNSEGELRDWEDLPFHDAIARYERHLIERALELSGGNKSDAARRLGIQRRLLYEKLQQLGSTS